MRTNQEMFDIAWQAFVVEKKPRSYSTDAFQTCRLRDQHGNKCAIGLAIPDNIYQPDMEDISDIKCDGEELLNRYPVLKEYFSADLQFMNELQTCHDDVSTAYFSKDIKEKLTELAENYNLEISRT